MTGKIVSSLVNSKIVVCSLPARGKTSRIHHQTS